MDPKKIDSSGLDSEKLEPLVGDKRPVENDGDGGDLGLRLQKKARGDSGEYMKRVAEIVMVLSELGKIRGGRSPTTVEKGLMAEARDRLSEMCVTLAPKDILPRDAAKVVAEDLGLDRSRDQRLGFRPPKMSILEKLLLTKRKMEESQEFAALSAAYSSQRIQVGFGSTSESHANFSVDHQMEKAPTWSLQSDSVAKVVQENKEPDHTYMKVEGTPEISTSQMTRDQTSKPFVNQTVSGNLRSVHQPLRDMNFVQAHSLCSNHNDISSNVHKFLQPRLPVHPDWTPPSMDYMKKALTCQICKITINNVESLLVCDACEKGVHLKCLQSFNQKGIPRGEWHCPKCLISSNGKPLPPKYGLVTRNISAPKVSSNIAGVQASSEKKVEKPDQKVNYQKIPANGNPGLLNPAHDSSTGDNNNESVADLKMSNARAMRGANFSACRIKIDNGDCHKTCMDNSRENSGAVSVPPLSATPNERSSQHIQMRESSSCEERSISEPKSQPELELGQSCPAKLSEADTDTYHHSQDVERRGSPNCNEVSSKRYHASTFKEFEKSNLRDTSNSKARYDIKQDDQDATPASTVGISGVGNGARDRTRSSSDGLHKVDWVGDILQVVDEKTFYRSCCINGVLYQLQDHALIRSNNDNLTPTKLQALWEDNKTRLKWAIVNCCYLPYDLPEVVGRPCSPENNEVYESNHDSTIMAGLIQGQCEVLHLKKFKEESERIIQLGHKANDGLQPIFLCKWVYDESKRLFLPVT